MMEYVRQSLSWLFAPADVDVESVSTIRLGLLAYL